MNFSNKMTASLAVALAFAWAAQAALPSNTANVRPGDYPLGNIAQVAPATFRLSGEHTWTADTYWRLYGIILVGNGAVLNIEPGTIVRGMNERATGVSNRPGMLIVERGGKIYANGTPALPIIFTDEWDNHFPWRNNGLPGGMVSNRQWYYRDHTGGINSTLPVGIGSTPSEGSTGTSYDYSKIGDMHGAWGGIVLCGRAFVNWDGMTGLGQATIAVEGVDASLSVVGGGTDDDDSSGELSYVQVRYGGYSLISSKEINGMTFYGVGRGTKMHHIEVYNNIDDNFEWFGGCNNGKYLVAWGVGDDVFDSDAGFRGKNQFLFGVQRNMGGSSVESGASDKGMEIDGYEKAPASGAYLFSASLWANITLVGMQYTTCNYNGASQIGRNVAISIRDNASPRIYNSIFMDFGSVATLIENRTDYTAKNGVQMNATERFTSAPTAGNFPVVPNGENTLMADGHYADAAHLYADGAMADNRQACIRGCYFWNIPSGLFYTGAASTGVANSSNPYWNAFPWTSATDGSGPWVSNGLMPYSAWATPAGAWDVTYPHANDSTTMIPITKRVRQSVTKSGTTSYDVSMIDPRPANPNAMNGAVVAPDQWLTPVRFVGAFEPEKNWAKGWTVISTLTSTGDSGQTIYGVFGETSLANALKVEGDVTTGGRHSLEMEIEDVVYDCGTPTIVYETVYVTNGVHGIVFEDGSALFDEQDPMVEGVPAINIKVTPQMTYTITVPGVYQLQTCDDLSVKDWQVVRTFSVPANAVLPLTVNVTDIVFPETAADRGFYRLLKQ